MHNSFGIFLQCTLNFAHLKWADCMEFYKTTGIANLTLHFQEDISRNFPTIFQLQSVFGKFI